MNYWEVPMPNIPYRMTFLDDESARVAAEVRERRGGRLLNLDRMLLHCPPLAEGWGSLMSRVRKGYLISQRHRELVICAVAKLNGADYESHYHVGRLVDAGASEAQVAALSDVATAAENEALFDPSERAVLRFLLESTRNVKISARALAAVHVCFPHPAQVLELMMLVASYNMVSRVLVGLGVEIEGTEAAV
jgi:alkylhydroperoxidase family enzyme